MIGLSQTTGYAVHALCCLEDPYCHPRLIRDIAQCTKIPRPYLAKIINQLSREGLVAAKRGYRGGIYLTRPPDQISLLEIIEAIEGQDFIAECMLGLDDCSTPCLCPTHEIWQRVRGEIKEGLRQSNLADILNAVASPGASLTAVPRRTKSQKKTHLRGPLPKVRHYRGSGRKTTAAIPKPS